MRRLDRDPSSRETFRERGGRTLREEGVLAALEGLSSLDEVLRVTHNEDGEDGQASKRVAPPRSLETAAAAVKEVA